MALKAKNSKSKLLLGHIRGPDSKADPEHGQSLSLLPPSPKNFGLKNNANEFDRRGKGLDKKNSLGGLDVGTVPEHGETGGAAQFSKRAIITDVDHQINQ